MATLARVPPVRHPPFGVSPRTRETTRAVTLVDALNHLRGHDELTPTGWSFRDDERVQCDSRDTNEGDTMVLADIGLGQLIWTTWLLFMLAALVWVFIVVVRDLFRNSELSGWAKAGWLVALILVPLLGSIVYIIVRGLWMGPVVGTAEDAAARAQVTRTEFERYDRGAADSTGTGPGGPT